MQMLGVQGMQVEDGEADAGDGDDEDAGDGDDEEGAVGTYSKIN